MNKRTIADVGMAYKWRISQGNSTKGSYSLTQCRRWIRLVARRADIKQAARITTVSTAKSGYGPKLILADRVADKGRNS